MEKQLKTQKSSASSAPTKAGAKSAPAKKAAPKSKTWQKR